MAKATRKANRTRLTSDEKEILYRAMLRHVRSLEKAINRCIGSLWPTIYAGEVKRTEELYYKLTGEWLEPTAEESP